MQDEADDVVAYLSGLGLHVEWRARWSWHGQCASHRFEYQLLK